MNDPIPIRIIGGGLAGLALGHGLRNQGVSVVLHEAAAYPRHRVCGEFISGLQPRTIERLGLGPALHDADALNTVSWFVRDRCVGTYRLPAPAYGISRYALDHRLADAFVAGGGRLETHSRAEAPAGAAGVVFATGRRRAASSAWIGLKIHARQMALRSDVEMHLGRNAYVGLSRVGGGVVNVCGLFRRGPIAERGWPLWEAQLAGAGLRRLAERLGRADFDPDSFCAVTALDFDRRFTVDGKHVAIGDAAAMIAPFTGNGMTMAFEGAEAALPALVAFARHELDWDDARRRINVALRDQFRRRLASSAVLHSFLLEPVRQRWLAALCRARLLPFRWLYAVLR